MKRLIFLILMIVNILAYGNPIIIGAVKFAPPYTSSVGNDDYYYGFCIDLMDALCEKMQETCQYKSTEFDTQLADLRQGRIDLAFLPSPIASTEDEDYLYSEPYLPSTGQFMTLDGSDIQSIKDLNDKKIGVIRASFLKNSFLALYTSPTNVYEYDNTSLLVNALNTHQIDALLLNDSVAKYLAHNVGNLKLLGKPIQFGLGYGITALKKNSALIVKINKALSEIEEDGTYAKIYNKYFAQ